MKLEIFCTNSTYSKSTVDAVFKPFSKEIGAAVFIGMTRTLALRGSIGAFYFRDLNLENAIQPLLYLEPSKTNELP